MSWVIAIIFGIVAVTLADGINELLSAKAYEIRWRTNNDKNSN